MEVTIRELIEADDEQANDLLNLVFQTSINRLNDIKLLRCLQPDGWFAACLDGQTIGTVSAISYGTVAHIGYMIVRPEMQGHGIGRMLMEHVIGWLERQKVHTITLDASEKGFPLYEKLGFIAIDKTSTFERQNNYGEIIRTSEVQTITFSDLDELVELDTAIFGADRRKVFQALLELYPNRAFLHRDETGKITGYIFAQMNRIGPWVMLNSSHKEELLSSVMTLNFDNPVSVCVPDSNQEVGDLLLRKGFNILMTATHMYKGENKFQCPRSKIFAQTSNWAG